MTKTLIDKIESLLVHDDHFAKLNLVQTQKFSIAEDHTLIEKIDFAPGDKQWEILFSRLTAFFEIGFLLEQKASCSQMNKMFFYGENIETTKADCKLTLPKSNFFDILKTDANAFVKKIGLEKKINAEKMTCLIVRLDNANYIALLTTLAEPWLQLRSQSLQKALTDHDYYTNN